MRKVVAILLLALLPLQWGAALAASYCKHEVALGQAHFGHHEHTRKPTQAAPKASVGGAEAAPAVDSGAAADVGIELASDADCGICHLGAIQGVVSTVELSVAPIGNELGADYQANWCACPSETFFRPPLITRP